MNAEVISLVEEYVTSLNQTLVTAPLWAVALTFAVTMMITKSLMNLHRSILLVVKYLKWIFIWLIKPVKLPKFKVKKSTVPTSPIGEYIIGSKGELYPVYK